MSHGTLKYVLTLNFNPSDENGWDGNTNLLYDENLGGERKSATLFDVCNKTSWEVARQFKNYKVRGSQEVVISFHYILHFQHSFYVFFCCALIQSRRAVGSRCIKQFQAWTSVCEERRAACIAHSMLLWSCKTIKCNYIYFFMFVGAFNGQTNERAREIIHHNNFHFSLNNNF